MYDIIRINHILVISSSMLGRITFRNIFEASQSMTEDILPDKNRQVRKIMSHFTIETTPSSFHCV